MTLHLALLWCASWLVPRAERGEWLAEWTAELWFVRRKGGAATAFSLGAFRDALWLRRNGEGRAFRLESPGQCLGVLSVMAVVGALLTFCWAPSRELAAMYRERGTAASFAVMVAIALVLLPRTSSFRGGAYPGAGAWRRRAFLAGKLLLAVPAVFCATLIVGAVIARGLQAHSLIVGLVLAFRWVLVDQRRRCPECLRLLDHPMRVGRPSQTFLEWYGTEFVCMKGHGLMHVPEIPTTSFETQRWMRLDRSWSGLFG